MYAHSKSIIIFTIIHSPKNEVYDKNELTLQKFIWTSHWQKHASMWTSRPLNKNI